MSDLNTEFQDIHDRYGSIIRAGVRQALGAETDAEDVIIECELALFTALRGSSERRPPRSLIYRIVRNKVADHLRQTIKQRRIIAEVERSIRERAAIKKHQSLDQGLSLTSAEIRVLSLLAAGLGNAEIAQRLSISKNTIRSHLKRIYKAIGCNNRLKVAIWANTLFKAEKDPAQVSHRRANPTTSDKSIA
jgi:RNA polymerase sigma factor (sigma-70 family)